MKLSALEPYGKLFTELYRQAVLSDRALRTAVAARRLRNRVVNRIFARMPSETGPGSRGKEWIKQTLKALNP
jgi:hypothetical protein